MQNTSYTISELAKEFGITTRTIRFYEEKGLLNPSREGGKRIYSPADRVRVDERRDKLLQQKADIDAMLAGLEHVESLCASALSAANESANRKID